MQKYSDHKTELHTLQLAGYVNSITFLQNPHRSYPRECSMARVGEFCAANVTRLVLVVVIVVALVFGAGVWLFYSPGRAPVINLAPQNTSPAK